MGTGRAKNLLCLASEGLNNLLWPSVCINCRSQIAQNNDRLCKRCLGELNVYGMDSYCRRCGCYTSTEALINDACPACQGQDFHFESIAACGPYTGTLKSMILAFKNSHCELSPMFGRLAERVLENSRFYDSIDYLVPVPLHWRRHFVRGYNQSLLVAKNLQNKEVKVNSDLVRTRSTAAQPTMSTASARARNVAGAFAVRKGHDFKGKRICLIDDIKTTGATLNECTKTLKQAGAEKVYAFVLAVAGQYSG